MKDPDSSELVCSVFGTLLKDNCEPKIKKSVLQRGEQYYFDGKTAILVGEV